MDLNALASSAALAGFFRLAMFRAIVQDADSHGKAVCSGLGQSHSDRAEYLTGAHALLRERGFGWDLCTQGIQNEADGLRWIKAAIEARPNSPNTCSCSWPGC